MNNTLYFILGLSSLIFGIYITTKQVKTFNKHEQDKLGFDIKLLGGGIGFIIIGIALLAKAL